MISNDVCNVLTSFLHQLQEAWLRLLDEEIKQFIDIDHLDEEFARNMKYGGEITHVMIRLLSIGRWKTRHQKAVPDHWDIEFIKKCLTLTEQHYDPSDLKIFDEKTVLQISQRKKESRKMTPSLATVDLKPKDSLLLCWVEDFTEMTASDILLTDSYNVGTSYV